MKFYVKLLRFSASAN